MSFAARGKRGWPGKPDIRISGYPRIQTIQDILDIFDIQDIRMVQNGRIYRFSISVRLRLVRSHALHGSETLRDELPAHSMPSVEGLRPTLTVR